MTSNSSSPVSSVPVAWEDQMPCHALGNDVRSFRLYGMGSGNVTEMQPVANMHNAPRTREVDFNNDISQK